MIFRFGVCTVNQSMEEPLSFVLFESPFSSVSTVSRGHRFLVSLGLMLFIYKKCFIVFMLSVPSNLIFSRNSVPFVRSEMSYAETHGIPRKEYWRNGKWRKPLRISSAEFFQNEFLWQPYPNSCTKHWAAFVEKKIGHNLKVLSSEMDQAEIRLIR